MEAARELQMNDRVLLDRHRHMCRHCVSVFRRTIARAMGIASGLSTRAHNRAAVRPACPGDVVECMLAARPTLYRRLILCLVLAPTFTSRGFRSRNQRVAAKMHDCGVDWASPLLCGLLLSWLFCPHDYGYGTHIDGSLGIGLHGGGHGWRPYSEHGHGGGSHGGHGNH